jgi:choline dehydrogenase
LTESFDYIVLGAGTAGCALAARLAGSGRRRVLLLEAGGTDRRFWVRVPIGYGRTFNDPRVNWMYESEPDAALKGRPGYWPRGKVLGGSGSINGMVYVRAFASDLEAWQAAGNPGWGYEALLPYFRALEDHEGGDARYHGRGGPIHITPMAPAAHRVCRTFIETCVRLGMRETDDFNGASPEGVGIYRITTRNGLRETTAQGYLRPLLGRRNLVLKLHALAVRVLCEGTRATGVAYRWRGAVREARASRAVVVCLGAIGTPQLLQLSGIGDPRLLRPLGIDAVHEAPSVGQNLQDHLDLAYEFRSKVPTMNDVLAPAWGKLKAGLEYLLTRHGPLAMSINQSGGFVKSDPSLRVPDLQLYFSPLSYDTTHWPVRRLTRPHPFSGFVLSFNPCRPTSRGRIVLRSADPAAAPRIFTDYLTTAADEATAIAGTRLLRRLVATGPLADIIASELTPPPDESDAGLLEDFRARASTVFHPTSSCRMGPDPAGAVVDARLRVHGMSALRIADASVFPSVTSGNTNATTIVVGLKAADLIIEEEGA